jgi:hypothetical protein
MADRGTIPARTTIASMPTVMPKTQTRRVKNCCQTGHSARTRDLSPPRSRFTFGYQQLMHKNCGKRVSVYHCYRGGRLTLRIDKERGTYRVITLAYYLFFLQAKLGNL